MSKCCPQISTSISLVIAEDDRKSSNLVLRKKVSGLLLLIETPFIILTCARLGQNLQVCMHCPVKELLPQNISNYGSEAWV